ncbi:MAG: bacteriohemerythrin [Treponema sp.]|jgi:hemerythrin|nr:bacteriohemerythrin [Treponema sp.]
MGDHFVEWDDRYMTGVQLLDDQHKELIRFTDELFNNCSAGDVQANESFKKTAHAAVEYVKKHFSAEEKMFENIKYPLAAEHKKQHEAFVKRVLEDVRKFEEGGNFVPLAFARFLREWILTHIAVHDKQYADFIQNLKRKGLLNAGL